MRNKKGQFVKGHRSSPATEFKKGIVPASAFKKGCPKPINAFSFPKGKGNHKWKNGRKKNHGYILVLRRDHPHAIDNYISEHRIVMEKHIGRLLKPEERVHHINGIKDDNSIKNLMLFDNESKHQKYHQLSK